jgi:hypothetical protein
MANDRGRHGRERASLIIGLVLIGFGILFLLGQFTTLSWGYFVWPFFIIIVGLAFFVGMLLGGKKASELAIPGSIITMVGLILFYQNLFNAYQTWAYAWALIPTAVGLGTIISGIWGDKPREVAAGRSTLITGLILFVAFGTFFELVIGISGFGVQSQWLWPVILIVLGLFIFWRSLFRPYRAEPARPADTRFNEKTDARSYDSTQTTILGSGRPEPTAAVPPALVVSTPQDLRTTTGDANIVEAPAQTIEPPVPEEEATAASPEILPPAPDQAVETAPDSVGLPPSVDTMVLPPAPEEPAIEPDTKVDSEAAANAGETQEAVPPIPEANKPVTE